MRRPQLRTRPARWIRSAMLGGTFVVAAGCSGGGKPIVVGAAGPWNEAYGAMNRKGLELAIDEINAKGGVRGRELKVIEQDDEGQGTRAAEVAAEFVANPELVAVIGHVNSGAMVAAAHVYDGELPAVATTATSPELTGISRWTFRVISSDSANGIALARFAGTLGKRRAAIIYENNSYGRGLADAFQKAFAGEIVSVDPIPEGTGDLEPFVSYYAQQKADIVFAAGTDASGLSLLREARRQKLDATFLGGDGWTGIVGDTAASTGAYVGAPFSSEDPRPEAQSFVRAFRKKYGIVPDGNAALAYDATKLVARAIEEVGPNRRRIRDWLAGLDEDHAVGGVTGAIRFEADGDPVGKSFVMTRVQKGLLEVAAQ
ncbi:MAG: ABC transporter substrate-binding protein [Gemmatimonadaceae bacterium]|nr:ABC transporter substrate-binding protein [Gemmatimonadaceae bacterium]NUQ94440.1 ABC transporter substrate-binding protein [Gemmatimonadaceae bacterium]NUR20820.1 ABC transporter substrate-binding protein [Gemmatimonadaceae bacterium]NUS96070.1 ABC transporter substrate-binding protein [Gemmatimonadaceae bacterium]